MEMTRIETKILIHNEFPDFKLKTQAIYSGRHMHKQRSNKKRFPKRKTIAKDKILRNDDILALKGDVSTLNTPSWLRLLC